MELNRIKCTNTYGYDAKLYKGYLYIRPDQLIDFLKRYYQMFKFYPPLSSDQYKIIEKNLDYLIK